MFVVGSFVAAVVLVVVALCLAAPFLLIAGGVWLVVRLAGGGRAPALVAPTARGDDPARQLGWAVGLLVTGLLWLVGARHFAAMLVGLGAGLLARRLVEWRRRTA